MNGAPRMRQGSCHAPGAWTRLRFLDTLGLLGIPASSAAGGSEPERRGPHWVGTVMTNGVTGSDTHKGGRVPTPRARVPGNGALGVNRRSTSQLDSDGASLAASGRSAGPGL